MSSVYWGFRRLNKKYKKIYAKKFVYMKLNNDICIVRLRGWKF